MTPRLHVLLTTTGRPTLLRLIGSLLPQLECRDHLTVLYDRLPGDTPAVPPGKLATHLHECPAPWTILRNSEPLGFWGHGSRNQWQNQLSLGDYQLHGDDDNAYLPGALAAVRQHCIRDRLYLFRARWGSPARLMWADGLRDIRYGNIDTGCVAVPTTKPRPLWPHVYGGDCDFIRACAEVWPVEYIDTLIYDIRPGGWA